MAGNVTSDQPSPAQVPAASPDQEELLLPVLRDDLDVTQGASLPNGAPSWVIFDRVANRYFEIGRELLDMLILWRVGEASKLIRSVEREFGRIITRTDVEDAIHFLISNALVRDIPGNDYALMAQRAEEKKKSLLSSAMHSYLFFRIPLFRPDAFLQATWPYVAPLFTKFAVALYALCGALGLYLVSRQWDQFTGTFEYMLSWEGAVFYGLSLVIVKSLHELGHAYMAVRYGLRVPTIGIAFMVLMPVLYTDTSGAWRLRSRRERLMIDAGGIFVELTLACLATLIWVFLPDGGVRLCFFAIATTSWITSLAVNLNPLMRFDGYYILSDTLGFQNLQNRGFEMARWRLREVLFGLGFPAPELLPRRMRNIIVLHAWATWIYRFFLFLGIAILVYTFFVKVIGIILFLVEIVWFILLPVGREIAHWWSIREAIMKGSRIVVTTGVLAGLVALSVIPWSTNITVPAVLTAGQEQAVFAPLAARIESLKLTDGATVKKGEVLAIMGSPELVEKRRQAEERASLLEARIDRSGSDVQDRASLIVLSNELSQVREELEGIARLENQLTVIAPFDGVLADVDHELHPGVWVTAKTPLARIQAAATAKIKGYVPEKDLFRFQPGAVATFVPEIPEISRIPVAVKDISGVSAEELAEPYLALRFGGSILTEQAAEQDGLKPSDAYFAVTMAPSDIAGSPRMAVRGVALVEGAPESFYTRAKRQVLKVFVREMGV